MITLFSGAVVDIPAGWALCDGTNGTPDLRDKFIVGAGGGYMPDDTGGNLVHTHDGTTDGHVHGTYSSTPGYGLGAPNQRQTSKSDTFTTDPDGIEPPYYALCYIKKLEE